MITPEDILAGTYWAGLRDVRDSAGELPEVLRGLLSEDPARIDAGLDTLNQLDWDASEDHRVYRLAMPAARYAAAILSDPRTAGEHRHEGDSEPYPLRTHLLFWLDSFAGTVTLLDVNEELDVDSEAAQRTLIDLYPPVAALFTDPNPAVRVAARRAVLNLLDSDRPEYEPLRLAAVPHLTAEPELLSEDEQEELTDRLAEWENLRQINARTKKGKLFGLFRRD